MLHIYFKGVADLEKKANELGLHLFTEDGKKFLAVSSLNISPLPDIPEDLIECVTFLEGEIYRGLRTEGIYRHGEAKLIVRTRKSSKDGTYSQSIESIGPSVASVKDIYSLVRQGKLQPVENWEAPMSIVSPIRSFWDSLRSKLPRFSNLRMFSKFSRTRR